MTSRTAATALGTLVVASFAAAGSASAQDTPRDSATARPMPATAASTTSTRPAGRFGNWSLGGDSDDMTNRADQRITVSADDSSSDPQGGKVLAQLIISCGNTYTRDSSRSMLFDAGIAMVNDPGELMLRTDQDKSPEKKLVRILDRAHTIAFIGGFGNDRYSGGFLQKLLRAKTLRVRYTPADADAPETVSFTLDGLSSALAQLTSCTWP